MGKNSFDLNSGGIYRPQNGKCKYYSNDRTNSRFVISMHDRFGSVETCMKFPGLSP